MSNLSDEQFEEGIGDEHSFADGVPPEVSSAEDEFDFKETPRHRSFTTTTPDGGTVAATHADSDTSLDEEDEAAAAATAASDKTSLRTRILLLLGVVIFLMVIFGGLYYLISGDSRTRTSLQVGSTSSEQSAAAARSQDEAQRQAQAALKSVTETVSSTPPATTNGGAATGDLSAPVAPDPMAASAYAPNAVSPYATTSSAGTLPAASSPATAATGSAANQSISPTVASTESASAQTRSERDAPGADYRSDGNSGAGGGSYYFFGRSAGASALSIASQNAAAALASQSVFVKPPFGAMLPVRFLDSVVTLRANSLVRLETTRALFGSGGWSVPRGTIIVARLDGGNNNRAYLSIVGLIDAAQNRLVKVTGEVKGSDGAQGVVGARKRVNSRLALALKKGLESGVSLGSAYFLGRRGGFYSSAQAPLSDVAQAALPAGSQAQNSNLDFIYVSAGTYGFVMITDLPEAQPARDAVPVTPGASATLNVSGELSDDELARLLTTGAPAQIRAALPRMNQDLRRIAESILAQDSQGEK